MVNVFFIAKQYIIDQGVFCECNNCHWESQWT